VILEHVDRVEPNGFNVSRKNAGRICVPADERKRVAADVEERVERVATDKATVGRALLAIAERHVNSAIFMEILFERVKMKELS